MRKLNSNNGHTIPIVLVIVIVLTIMTSSVVYAVSVSTKRTNAEIIESTNKLVLENATYAFVNDFIVNEELRNQEFIDYEYNNCSFTITPVENDTNIYVFSVTNDSNYKLNATIEFNFDANSYKILKWGFVKG